MTVTQIISTSRPVGPLTQPQQNRLYYTACSLSVEICALLLTYLLPLSTS